MSNHFKVYLYFLFKFKHPVFIISTLKKYETIAFYTFDIFFTISQVVPCRKAAHFAKISK